MAEKKKLVKVEVVRSYWDDDGQRHDPGEVIELPENDRLKDLVNSGVLKLK